MSSIIHCFAHLINPNSTITLKIVTYFFVIINGTAASFFQVKKPANALDFIIHNWRGFLNYFKQNFNF